jgi:hypothetical protein
VGSQLSDPGGRCGRLGDRDRLHDRQRQRNRVWIVIERREDAMRYARVVPDCIAGTISVTCSSAVAGEECRVAVEYDVTTLGPAGGAFVRELESDYDGFLESWRDEIVAALGLEEELPR